MRITEQNEAAERFKRFRVPLQRSDGFWITSDLYCAAFFATRGNEIVGVELSGQDRRFSFVICARREFRDDLHAWMVNGAIPVRDFIDGVYLAKEKLREFGF